MGFPVSYRDLTSHSPPIDHCVRLQREAGRSHHGTPGVEWFSWLVLRLAHPLLGWVSGFPRHSVVEWGWVGHCTPENSDQAVGAIVVGWLLGPGGVQQKSCSRVWLASCLQATGGLGIVVVGRVRK